MSIKGGFNRTLVPEKQVRPNARVFSIYIRLYMSIKGGFNRTLVPEKQVRPKARVFSFPIHNNEQS